MADETPAGGAAAAARASRFKEANMNSTSSSIRPPPGNFWRDLNIDHLIQKYNDDGSSPTTQPKAEAAPVAPASSTTTHQSTFGRFSRAVTSFWKGPGLSVLGKRKIDVAVDNEKENGKRKEQVEQAYKEAKELGLLPTPKVFIRPKTRGRPSGTSVAASVPTSPALRKTPSKKDLHKQQKLSKRVSDLEFKLSEARKELIKVLNDENAPPVPPIPTLPLTPSTAPTTPHFWSQSETEPHNFTEAITPRPSRGKLIRKRKATPEDEESDYIPKAATPETESEYNESDRSTKKSKLTNRANTTSPMRQKSLNTRRSTRLRKKSSTVTKEEVFIVVPDGVTVPHIPSIPNGVQGNRVKVNDDGYGGVGHEMF
ncbi:hypothetical protein P154DRAFT_573379 [Amniculicola lignicola CBS 123094]|uniref:Uncharacterized protein n=1 Tax=Amniculicola lignicola CBS 123094 TaxID=1392246 RepID=A0A6A5WQC0_9PLEO|nr:hypothetical protein P154DRAFT_573379 [Amniculicola lignicola CBS 123094]